MAADPRPEAFLPLSPAEFQILLALGDGPLHGYAIMQAVEDRTGPSTILGPGTLYGALKRLRKRALIEQVAGTGGDRRLPYRLTRLGRAVARAEADRHRELVRWAEAAKL